MGKLKNEEQDRGWWGEGQSVTGFQEGSVKSGYASSRTKAGGLHMWLQQPVRAGSRTCHEHCYGAPSEAQARERSSTMSQMSHLYFLFCLLNVRHWPGDFIISDNLFHIPNICFSY